MQLDQHPHRYQSVNLYFQDESRFGLLTHLGRCVTARGVRPVVPYQHRFQATYLYGSYSPIDGSSFVWEVDGVSKLLFHQYLQEFSQYRPHEYKIVWMDNAGFHSTQGCELPQNVALLRLPAYSPELNPAEQVWGYLKQRFKNQVFRGMEELLTWLHEAVRGLSAETIRQITSNHHYREAFSATFKCKNGISPSSTSHRSIRSEQMKLSLTIKQLLLLCMVVFLAGCDAEEEAEAEAPENWDMEYEFPEITGEYEAELTPPPFVPGHPTNEPTDKVVIDLEIIEEEAEMMDGTEYLYWTFGGTVPGSFIRVWENDLVEFHLHNHPDNKLPHNIDLHAVTGPGGGAEASMTAPGHTSVFSFRPINPGLYVYHCATAPVGMHIANGMYGLILVEDRDNPLPPVDKEFYVMQGEFYTQEKYGFPGLHNFDMQEAQTEIPDYVVFNGSVGAMLEEEALQVKVGETVRLYVGNGGPNLVSSFHVIGEIFDRVYMEGGSAINENVQTTLVPAGGAAIVEFKCEVPGALHMVDHSVFRAFNKGAIGQIDVNGPEEEEVYTGKQRDEVYMLEGSSLRSIYPPKAEDEEVMVEKSFEERMEAGQTLYVQNCASCHQINGQGIPGAFPPLAGADYLMELESKGIDIVAHGLSGPITVNGVKYNSVMPALGFEKDEIANVLTYVRNSWGNDGGIVTLEEVRTFLEGQQ